MNHQWSQYTQKQFPNNKANTYNSSSKIDVYTFTHPPVLVLITCIGGLSATIGVIEKWYRDKWMCWDWTSAKGGSTAPINGQLAGTDDNRTFIIDGQGGGHADYLGYSSSFLIFNERKNRLFALLKYIFLRFGIKIYS